MEKIAPICSVSGWAQFLSKGPKWPYSSAFFRLKEHGEHHLHCVFIILLNCYSRVPIFIENQCLFFDKVMKFHRHLQLPPSLNSDGIISRDVKANQIRLNIPDSWFVIGHSHYKMSYDIVFYDFAFKKRIVGHILNKIIVIWFFKPYPGCQRLF